MLLQSTERKLIIASGLHPTMFHWSYCIYWSLDGCGRFPIALNACKKNLILMYMKNIASKQLHYYSHIFDTLTEVHWREYETPKSIVLTPYWKLSPASLTEIYSHPNILVLWQSASHLQGLMTGYIRGMLWWIALDNSHPEITHVLSCYRETPSNGTQQFDHGAVGCNGGLSQPG